MAISKLFAIVLLAAGILALSYRGFTYTKETHNAKVGPVKISVNEDEHVTIPVWAGVGLAVVGGALLLNRKK